MIKILIATRHFVREVSELVCYARRVHFPAEFCVTLPIDNAQGRSKQHDFGAARIRQRKVYFPHRMRAACYESALFRDVLAFQPDILHLFEEFSGLIAFQTLLFNRILGRNSKVLLYSAENLPRNMRPVFRPLMRYVMRHSDAALVCSHGVTPILKGEGYTKPIEVFPLGVDISQFYKFSVESLKMQLKLDGKFVIGYVGRLLEIKGVLLLIEMMRHLSENVHLLMVGSGPEEARLRDMAAAFRVAHRVHFAGAVPYSELPRYMNCMDLGIAPSQTTPYWKEQFGRVLVEFMSCEVPVIGSNSGSIPEVIGEAGYIFPEHRLAELIRIIQDVIEQPEQRRNIGQRGRERVRQHYSMEIMCQQIVTMYETLINEEKDYT